MYHILILSSFLLISSFAYGFTCPKNEGFTFQGDISTACQVYFMCYKGQKTSLRCQNGFTFDDYTSRCSDASEFVYNSDRQLTRSKRSDVMIHSISKVKAKDSSLDLINVLITNVKDTLKEVSPSIHDSLEENFVNILKSIKDDILPILKHTALPKKQNYTYAYAKDLKDRIIKNLYQSWGLSNSTHVHLVSFSDILSDIPNDLKNITQLGRYFSSSVITTRTKRSIVLARSIFDTIATVVQPVLKMIFKSVVTAVGGDDPFMKDYALPMLFEILDDSQSTIQIREILWKANNIFSPISNQIFRGRRYKDVRGVTYMISTPELTKAVFKFYTEAEPICKDIVKRHLQMILIRSAQNLPVITDTLERLSVYARKEAKELKNDLLLFFAKHSEYFLTNDKSFRNIKNFVQMSNDWIHIKMNLIKVFKAYLRHSPNSIVKFLMNWGSTLKRLP